MVERSLRMRQVQGSMPCTSIRLRGRFAVYWCGVVGERGRGARSAKKNGGRFFPKPAAPPTGVNASSWFPPKFPPG